jgi:hypothetical protein
MPLHFPHGPKHRDSHSKDSPGNSLRTNSTSSTSELESGLTSLAVYRPHPSSDPVKFCQEALAPIFASTKQKDFLSLDTLEHIHIPAYYADNFHQRINCREPGNRDSIPSTLGSSRMLILLVLDLIETAKLFRDRFHSHRIRFREAGCFIDSDGSADVRSYLALYAKRA